MTRRTGTVADMEMAPMDVPQYRDTFGDDGSTGSGQVLSMDVDYVSQVKRRKKTMSYLAVAALVLEVIMDYPLILVVLVEMVLDIVSVDLLFIMLAVAAVEMKIRPHHPHLVVEMVVVEI